MKVESTIDVLNATMRKIAEKRSPPVYKRLVRKKMEKAMYGKVQKTKGCRIDVKV